ncbi:MAG: 50S ribosomal protein L25 [Candidatus Hydrogenedentota bacterium]
MDKFELKAEPRTSLGSGSSRRYRRQGKVPAVLYGHGAPHSLLVDSKTLDKALHTSAGRNVFLSLVISGAAEETAIIRDIQRHPVSRAIAHADFQRVSLTEKIITTVHLEFTGSSEAVKAGGILIQMVREVEIEASPMDMPSHLTVDVSVLKEIGDSIHAAALAIPSGVRLVTQEDVTIATVQPPAAEEVAPVADAAAVAGAAEPEVIGKGKEEAGKEGETKDAGKDQGKDKEKKK